MGQRHLDRGALRRRLHQRSRQARAAVKLTEAAVEQAHKATFLLCAVLAQCGGTKTLTQGTLDQCMGMASQMGFQMKPSAQPGEYDLVLLVRDEADESSLPTAAQAIASPTPGPKVTPLIITP